MAGRSDAVIRWHYDRQPEFFIGADATPAEKGFAWTAALAAPVILYSLAWRGQVDWALGQWILAVLLAIDVAGGVTANALSALKRLTFSPPNPSDGRMVRLVKRWPILFPLAHVHPLAIMWAYGGGIAYGLIWYLTPILSFLIVHRLALYLQRPAAFSIVALAIVVSLYGPTTPIGFEWFAPLFIFKLVACHGLREEPYAP